MKEGVGADHHVKTEFLDEIVKISVFIWPVKLSICLVCNITLITFCENICSLHKRLFHRESSPTTGLSVIGGIRMACSYLLD